MWLGKGYHGHGSDVLAGDGMQWSALSGKGVPPLPRSLHSAVLLKNKMYVFGGWIPVQGEDGSFPAHETEWKCSNSLACLNTGEGWVWSMKGGCGLGRVKCFEH